jgi:hypothetical protein
MLGTLVVDQNQDENPIEFDPQASDHFVVKIDRKESIGKASPKAEPQRTLVFQL